MEPTNAQLAEASPDFSDLLGTISREGLPSGAWSGEYGFAPKQYVVSCATCGSLVIWGADAIRHRIWHGGCEPSDAGSKS